MAKVQGVKEKIHMPIYDSFFVPGAGTNVTAKKFKEIMKDQRMIRFFVDIQNKTRLETNLQASGVLPSLNTFEARALRVVVAPKYQKEDVNAKRVSSATFLHEFIFNSVTTLLVGEKTMIEVPTFYFPAGAGVYTGSDTDEDKGHAVNHGEPDPLSTFRFAEPVFIEPQQNFRVEISFPQGVPERVFEAEGPRRIWVMLDGYLTRDVQ